MIAAQEQTSPHDQAVQAAIAAADARLQRLYGTEQGTYHASCEQSVPPAAEPRSRCVCAILNKLLHFPAHVLGVCGPSPIPLGRSPIPLGRLVLSVMISTIDVQHAKIRQNKVVCSIYRPFLRVFRNMQIFVTMARLHPTSLMMLFASWHSMT